MSECDCSSHATADLKSLEQALDLLLAQARPVSGVVQVELADALGRVLAQPILSEIDVPPWDNSAMDGYAVRSADITAAGTRLRISQRIPAGASAEPLEPATAARIFTGAPLPANADAVVIQEQCRREGEQVIVEQSPRPGANIRQAGEDTRQGQEVLPAGVRLGPQHLGLLASVGVARLPVHRRLRVAIFSSGDELVMPGQPLAPGQIFNSNEFTLEGLLRNMGCEPVKLGIVTDTFDGTCTALRQAAANADLIITSGGVSVGEEDHIKPAVEQLGSLDLWQIAIRPGKPLAFGHIDGTPFIGTPGNPVSLFVTFCLLARPFILRQQGVAGCLVPATINAVADFDWPRPGGRREFARARLSMDDHGQARVSIYPSRSSGVLSSLAWANGLAVLPEQTTLEKGDRVEFLSFSELLS